MLKYNFNLWIEFNRVEFRHDIKLLRFLELQKYSTSTPLGFLVKSIFFFYFFFKSEDLLSFYLMNVFQTFYQYFDTYIHTYIHTANNSCFFLSRVVLLCFFLDLLFSPKTVKMISNRS